MRAPRALLRRLSGLPNSVVRSAGRARDTQAFWDNWSKTLKDALIDSVDPSTIEAAGGAQAFKGRGRVNNKMRSLRPPTPCAREGNTMDALFESDQGAHARKLARTVTTFRHRLAWKQ